jgi:ribosomal protein S18 acetylase RimI-like enzyme
MYVVPTVRLAVPDEAIRIALMSREYIEFDLGWSWRRERVLSALADPATNVAVAPGERGLIGFGIMQYGDQDAHLALLAVAPALRRRGAGARLVAWLEAPARVAGLEKVRLELRADNPDALSFYRRQGFEVTGRVPGYYGGVMDAIRMEKSLRAA